MDRQFITLKGLDALGVAAGAAQDDSSIVELLIRRGASTARSRMACFTQTPRSGIGTAALALACVSGATEGALALMRQEPSLADT